MNYIEIIEPLWHKQAVLIAPWKIGSHNEIVIKHKDYPLPYYMTDEQIRKYPTRPVQTKHHGMAAMYCIPIAEMTTDLVLAEL